MGLITFGADYPEKNNDDWFCHAQLKKDDNGKMTSFKRPVAPYIVEIDEEEMGSATANACRRKSATTKCNYLPAKSLNTGERTAPLAPTPTTVPVTVDEEKCIAEKGCTVCVDVCPLDVLRISEESGKAYMKYDECWYCMPCGADCPTGAVNVSIPYLLR